MSSGTKKVKAGGALGYLLRMCGNSVKCKKMSTERLIEEAIGVWGHMDMAAYDTAVVEALIDRLSKYAVRDGKVKNPDILAGVRGSGTKGGSKK